MRLLRKDLKTFSLFVPIVKKNGYETLTTFGDAPALTFRGHIQPWRADGRQTAYGREIKATHVVYAAGGADIAAGGRLSDGARLYVIGAVKRWPSYVRLLVEEARGDGRH